MLDWLVPNTDCAAPPSKKRKLEDGKASTPKKAKNQDEIKEVSENEEDDAAEAPDSEDDEHVGESDEPGVTTKVITGSETKQAAAEVSDEEYEKEDEKA